MLCQRCQKRIANVHFTQAINNKKIEMYLCEQCAREKGDFSFGSPLSINNLLSSLIGMEEPASYVQTVPKSLVCKKCGMSYEEFQKIGKLGCDKCYEVFTRRLEPLVKRLHGNTGHNGKVPGNVSGEIKLSKEIEKLREQLNKSIRNEDYEKAAQLRDKIRSLEIKPKSEGGNGG